MIRRGPSGKLYCDGRECGYLLQWFQGDPEEDGAAGEWVCLDCGSSMWGCATAQLPTRLPAPPAAKEG